jgi:hypothetical protein
MGEGFMEVYRGISRGVGVAMALALLVAPTVAQQSFSRGYGAAPSPEEKVRSLTGTPEFRSFLPEVVDLSSYFPVPGDQGMQGSCTAWATGYAARAYYAAAVEERRITSPQSIPSPAFIYNLIVADPNDCGSGSSNTLALEVLKQFGSLSLADYPYLDETCALPSDAQFNAVSDFRIKDYMVVDHTRLDQVKGELADGNPVIIRIVPEENFDTLWNQPDGVWHAPPLPEDSFGHAMVVVGYNEARQTFKFINSWGPDWSDGGYGRMDYQTFLNRVTEAFVMVLPTGEQAIPVADLDPEEAPAPEEPIVHEEPVDPVDPTPKQVVDFSGLQCAKVQISKDGSRKVAEGFVSTPADLDLVTTQLQGEVDEVDIKLAPWPQCEALLTLDAQLAEKDAPTIAVTDTEPKAGDTFGITVETPDFDSYVHIAYVQADGTVVNLQQVDADHLSTIDASSEIKFGDGLEGRDQFEVSGPYGDEMLLVISSRSPLFAEPRPQTETEREFLTALREAILTRPNKKSPERFISAAFLPIHTSE